MKKIFINIKEKAIILMVLLFLVTFESFSQRWIDVEIRNLHYESTIGSDGAIK